MSWTITTHSWPEGVLVLWKRSETLIKTLSLLMSVISWEVFTNLFSCRVCQWLPACLSHRVPTWNSSSALLPADIWTISFLPLLQWVSSPTTRCFWVPVKPTQPAGEQHWGGPSWRCSGRSLQLGCCFPVMTSKPPNSEIDFISSLCLDMTPDQQINMCNVFHSKRENKSNW